MGFVQLVDPLNPHYLIDNFSKVDTYLLEKVIIRPRKNHCQTGSTNIVNLILRKLVQILFLRREILRRKSLQKQIDLVMQRAGDHICSNVFERVPGDAVLSADGRFHRLEEIVDYVLRLEAQDLLGFL